jgi:hypothetical protein
MARPWLPNMMASAGWDELAQSGCLGGGGRGGNGRNAGWVGVRAGCGETRE